MIPHNQPWINEADRQAVDAILSSGYVGHGPAVEALEADIATVMGGGSSCALSSGTAALYLSLLKLGAGCGDRIAVPTYACSALLNAVAMAGAVAEPVDIDPSDFNMSAPALAAYSPDSRIAIAVHTYGARCDIEGIESSGRIVIEDACQTMIGEYPGTGSAVVYSFYATKPLAGGHGGAAWSRDSRIVEEIHDYRNFDGRRNWVPRFNFHMADIQAGLVRSQLQRREEIIRQRRRLYDRFTSHLPAGFGMQAGLSQAACPYRCVLVAPDRAERDRFLAHSEERGVRSIVPLERYELLHRYLGLQPELFPAAEAVVDRTLSLPLYPALTDQDADRVVACLDGFH